MILITGGMGFIGLHTARRILDAGEDVVLTMYKTRREPSFIKDELGKRAKVEQVDVTDADALVEVGQKHNVDGIVHLAVPALAQLSPSEDYHVNMDGLINIMEAARRLEVRRMTLASSIAVYSGVPNGPFLEDTPLPVQSGNPTEAFKKSFEILGLHYADRAGMDVVCMRISGIWGPVYHSMANLPSRLAHAAVKGVEADLASARGGVPFEDDGSDLCYVKDCAQGIQLLQMADTLPHRIYNVASGVATTYGELRDAVQAVVPESKITLQPGAGPRAKKDPYLDIGRISEVVGYKPQYDVRSGMADYIAWLRQNPQ